jgi:8-hydroxy-5-deazaflavin:NADPH oxidoreductase
MEIGIVGAGKVALAVARPSIKQGHRVTIGSKRGPTALGEIVKTIGPGARAATVAEVAKAGVVLLAVPWLEVENVLRPLPSWDGRILIDATNPFIGWNPLKLADLRGRSSSVIVAGQALGAKVVKAFNSLTMVNFEKGPTEGNGRRVLFVSGDDRSAKQLVSDLITSFGYAVIDLGDLDEGGRFQQPGGPLAGKDLLLAS